MNLPNALTIIRILLVPLFLYKVIQGETVFAIVVYVTAAVTDGLDGFIAKAWKMQTKLGTFLDPLADKILVATSYLTLAVLEMIPLSLAITVLSRDIIIALGSLTIYLMKGDLTVRPHPVGKVTTFFQFLYILLVLSAAVQLSSPWFVRTLGPMAVITGILTVTSGAIYILDGLRSLEE
ncbi:MAG: CDP-alcohol phosphatidyltransferase family protein [bacterium]|nr:CDP-alcohol phosphatidyltransferase family protein [bacterium]